MKSIPLTRARHASNFATVLRSRGIATERYLERSHLPVGLLDEVDRDSVLSAISMLDFAENAAADSGISDLGFWAGLMPIEQYGQFGARVSRASTLFSALEAFCNGVGAECSEANYYLRHDGPAMWFCHHQGPSSPLLSQHELYALMIMVQVVRLALGEQWKPSSIRLQWADERSLTENELLVSTNIEFGSAETGFKIAKTDLAKPLIEFSDRGFPVRAKTSGDYSTTLRIDPLIALRALTDMQLHDGKVPSLELTAELAGASVRTIQRHLRNSRTSFSDLVDEARLKTAKALICDESISITHIAYETGYSNVANFSRSFKRLTGMSPRSYRKMILVRQAFAADSIRSSEV
jgi:AraC-like DNA-binding protein